MLLTYTRKIVNSTVKYYSGDFPKLHIQMYRNINQDTTIGKGHASLLGKSTKRT